MAVKIKNWDSLYETHETRKIKRLQWVPVPNKHDGAGFRRIAARKDSCELFTAWILLLQIASKSPERGILPESPGDAAYKTGYPERIFSKAYSVLSSKEIAWIEIDCQNSLTLQNNDENPKTGESPGTPGENPGTSRLNGMEWNGIEGNGNEYSCAFLEFWKAYPKKRSKGAAWKEWQKENPPLDVCLKTLAWQVKSKQWLEDGGKYIPDPERWIKKRKWEDELPGVYPAPARAKAVNLPPENNPAELAAAAAKTREDFKKLQNKNGNENAEAA